MGQLALRTPLHPGLIPPRFIKFMGDCGGRKVRRKGHETADTGYRLIEIQKAPYIVMCNRRIQFRSAHQMMRTNIGQQRQLNCR